MRAVRGVHSTRGSAPFHPAKWPNIACVLPTHPTVLVAKISMVMTADNQPTASMPPAISYTCFLRYVCALSASMHPSHVCTRPLPLCTGRAAAPTAHEPSNLPLAHHTPRPRMNGTTQSPFRSWNSAACSKPSTWLAPCLTLPLPHLPPPRKKRKDALRSVTTHAPMTHALDTAAGCAAAWLALRCAAS